MTFHLISFRQLTRHSIPRIAVVCAPKRFHTDVNFRKTQLADVRNIGIVAHIDAGKTTVTERMLFYAGAQRRIGDVDRGNTTTDFMQEEMDRGITIQAAAVTFPWKGKVINLIDTPGHVDFNMEVERSLRVLEGVIGVFDAAVGVQGQSHIVLQQARKHNIPMIAFINKMDKPNAKFEKAVDSLSQKLGVCPLCLQGPIGDGFQGFDGVIDFLDMKAIRWVMPEGIDVQTTELSVEPKYVQEIATAGRLKLVDILLTRDEILMEEIFRFMEENACDEEMAKCTMPRHALIAAIQRQCRIVTKHKETESAQIVPVLCGAARRNKGVQPLLDFTLELLPCPTQVRLATDWSLQTAQPPKTAIRPINIATALVFKVSYHADGKTQRHGLLSFFRVYDGKVSRGKYFNSTRKCFENITQVYIVHGDALKPVDFVPVGCIGVTYSSTSFTGDTWVNEGARNDSFHLPGIDTPRPVVSTALEPFADDHTKTIHDSLHTLCREDPSLQTKESARGEIILQGMGDLHLEIALSKMQRIFGVRCALQAAMIEYHESVRTSLSIPGGVIRDSFGSPSMELGIRIEPKRDSADDEVISTESIAVDIAIDKVSLAKDLLSRFEAEEIETILTQSELCLSNHRDVIVQAVRKGLENSPRMHVELLGARVVLTRVLAFSDRLKSRDIENATTFFISDAIRQLQTIIVEPYMKLELNIVDEKYTNAVVQDLRARDAKSITVSDQNDSVEAVLAMSRLRGYSAALRRITKGHAQYWYKLDHYRQVVRRT